MPSDAPVTITAIVPLHDVEAFVGDFLRSLERQRPGDYDLDLVFVDDASPDSTARIVAEWMQTTAHRTVLLRQPHGGVSKARNHGLSHARGQWVTFPDPDDLLDPGYFAALAQFLRTAAEDIDVVSANIFRVFDPDPQFQDVHALRFRFFHGSRVVSLEDEPDIFQLNVATALFRRDRLVETGVTFQSGLHASEDALFVSRFLLSRPHARIGLVAEARYGYRKRASRDSAVDSYQDDPSAYIDRFRDGYLPILEEAAASGGVPAWLQSILLYECQWLLPRQLDPQTYAAGLDAQQRRDARDAVSACLAHVDADRVLRYDATALPLESRLVVLALSGRRVWNWVGYYAERPRPGQRRVTLRGYTTEPEERVLVLADGRLRELQAVKVRPLDYFGQTRLYERALRVPSTADAVQDGDLLRPVVVARAGETWVQAAERHRRAVTGQAVQSVPSQPGAVRVWKFRKVRWRGPVRLNARENVMVLAARARHDLRVGKAFLDRFAPRSPDVWTVVTDDPDLGRGIRERAADHGVRVRLVPTRGGRAGRGVRGRMRGLLGELRSGVVLATSVAAAASLPATSARRVLLVRGAIQASQRVGIDALGPDLVVTDDVNTQARLREESSLFPGQIVLVPPADGAEGIVRALISTRTGARR